MKLTQTYCYSDSDKIDQIVLTWIDTWHVASATYWTKSQRGCGKLYNKNKREQQYCSKGKLCQTCKTNPKVLKGQKLEKKIKQSWKEAEKQELSLRKLLDANNGQNFR